jgi:O-antigen biosynthesis protein
MKTLFAKYNNERLPQFQTVTKIVELADGSLNAIKQALTPKADAHIAEIYANYARLTNSYPQIKLVVPTLENAATVTFPMASGVSLEKLLKQFLDKQEKTEFFILLDKFIAYVDTFVAAKQVKFEPCDKFKQIFAEWTLSEPQDLIILANVDMIFSNLFVADDGLITQIDYEWVFDCAVPKTFILWRAFNVFAYFTNLHIYKFISLTEIFEHYNILNYTNQQWLSMDLSWQAYIRGENTPYMLKDFMQREQICIFDFVSQLQQQVNTQNISMNGDLKYSKLQQELINKVKELDGIYSSKSWKIVVLFRKIKQFFTLI